MYRACLVLLLILSCLCPGCGPAGRADQRDLAAAREAFGRGFYLEAESAYERYLQQAPQGEGRLEAWNRLLEIALNVKGDQDKALGLLEAMYLEFGNRPDLAWQMLFRLGDLYEQRGDRAKALASWEKCLEVRDAPQDMVVEARIRMARIYRAQGKHDLVVDLLKGCASRSVEGEHRARCLYDLAQTYILAQDWDKAKTTLEGLLEIKAAPEDLRAMAVFLLADYYEYAQDIPRAIELLESVRAGHPNPMVVDSRLEGLRAR
ncbi:MAG: tetratricopeptide repeat protein [Desulfovibrionaceae bacterium]|nr:tetratricopeptide repeat protein [Desulfovibrionaceae bacterium]